MFGSSKYPLATVLVAIALAAGLTGCAQSSGTTGVPGILARLRPLEKNCHGRPMNGYAALDLDDLDRGSSLIMQHVAELGGAADQVAACGGYLKMVGYGRVLGDTQQLAGASFPEKFGTDTARLLHANKIIEAVLGEARASLPKALRAISPTGNNVMAQYFLAEQYERQRPGARLYLDIATSGVSTLGPVPMDTKSFRWAVASAAGRHVPVPNLSGALVRMTGIGTADSNQPLPANNLHHFYTVACARTHASCLITTDYTPTGD